MTVPDALPNNGLQKAAVLLVQMGKEASVRVLSQLREAEVEELTAEIARMRSVAPDTADAVLTEFHSMLAARQYAAQGGLDFAREVLEASLGRDRASDMISRLSVMALETPFQFLHRADPRQLLSFVQDEHPQVIALVLAHLTAEMASRILSGLSPELQADVAHRIAVMDRTSPDTIRLVETSLERKLSSVLQPGELSTVGGLKPLVDIINRADRATERLIMQGLEGRDPKLAEDVRSQMFLFEDIVGLDDRAVQQVLRQVETADLACAIKGVSLEVRDKVMSNLSERAAANLAEEVEMLGAVRLHTVEEAQAKVIRAIRAMEESGEILLRRGDDDEFVV